MTSHSHSTINIKTDYPFLALSIPQKQSHQTQTIRPRSSTFSAIASWAAHVQPGSPGSLSPYSPHRRPSIVSIRTPSASFLHIAPTPSACDFKADLTTVGYTSVFLQLPNTPMSAMLSFSRKPTSPDAAKNIPIPPLPSSLCKPRGFTRFRSLSVLRSRGRSKSVCPDSPTKVKAKAAAAIVKRKKAKYVMRPPPLSSELALMQFADGGNMDDSIKRLMAAQARATGAVGLADVHRDGDNGVWLDQDEEWEYTHLLAEGDESRPHDLQWVTFGGNTSPSTMRAPEDERRGSLSTLASDLDPTYVVQPVNLLDGDDPTLFGGAIVPIVTCKPSMTVLSIPPRPHRAAKHLRKPEFLVDLTFSHLLSPKSPKSINSSSMGIKPKGKARRRPAPLTLSPPSPTLKRPINSPIDPDKIRQEFIAASFEPVPVSVPVTPSTSRTLVSASTLVDMRTRLGGGSRAINVPWRTINDDVMTSGMKKKPSMLNVMALFRSGARKA